MMMRSLITFEVEHDYDDSLEAFADYVSDLPTDHGVVVREYRIETDLPENFDLMG